MPKKGQTIYRELDNYDFLFQKRREEKLELSQIAKIVGCSRSNVFRALKKFGITPHLQYPELRDSDFLWEKYWEEELSTPQIAKIVGCGDHTVSSALKRCGIMTRAKSECSRGKNNPMYGRHHSDATKQKIREKVGVGKDNALFGKPFTKDHKEKIGEASRNPSEEKRKKLSDASKGKKNGMYGKHSTKETRQKLSDIGKKHWRDPEYIKKVIAGRNKKPNTIEKTMNILLQKYLPGEFRYNGNFDCGISIGNKIPDFVNVNGNKTVIEVFGPWHNEQFMKQYFDSEVPYKRTEIGTKAVYSEFGFTCIIFWESDLKREDAEHFVLCELEKNGALKKEVI